MLLSAETVVHHLKERGLLSADEIVGGGLMVEEVVLRNHNFRVVQAGSLSFFVKQGKTWDPQTLASIRREAEVYAAVNDKGRETAPTAALAPLLPRFRDFDPRRHALVLELIPAAESLSQVHLRTGKFPSDIAAALGAALATLHRPALWADLGPKLGSSTSPGGSLPWVLQMSAQAQMIAERNHPVLSQVFQAVCSDPSIQQGLGGLAASWQRNGIIHGDIKFDNALLAGGADSAMASLKLIDWELAEVGDITWDVGAVFHAYLMLWALSFPVPGQPEAMPPIPLQALQPAIQAFWRTYWAARAASRAEERSFLDRSLRCAAARAVQSCYEAVLVIPELSPRILRLLQLSSNIFARSEDAISLLLGL
jgi:serine/threonine protein kinase